MRTVHHRITIGSDTWSAARNSRLLTLRCSSSLLTPVNECEIVMTSPVGINAEPGDPVEVAIGYTDESDTVFTGIVGAAEAAMDRLVIRAQSTARHLTAARLDLFFEKTAAGDIISDLCGKLNISKGQIDSGIDLPYYALGSNQSAVEHAWYLAGLCGFDLFSDEEDKLVFAPRQGASRDFQFGVNILALAVNNPAPGVSGVEVFGDSAAGKQGTDAAYWVAKSAVKGKAGDEAGALIPVFAGAARTEDLAQKMAAALLQQRAAKKHGSLKTPGNAALRLGDTIAVSDMPLESQNGNYTITGILHTINPVKGFISTLKIESTEGTWSLSSLL